MFDIILLAVSLTFFGLILQGLTRLIKAQDKQHQLLEEIAQKLDEK